jgi:hypothetical protein
MSRNLAVTSSAPQRLANALGWFSLALGAAELMAPKPMAQWLGMRHGAPILKTYGAREIASGMGILATRNKAPAMWSRVAGDALDMASLVSVAIERPSKRRNAGIALAAVAGVAALDIACAVALSRGGALPRRRQARVTHGD